MGSISKSRLTPYLLLFLPSFLKVLERYYNHGLLKAQGMASGPEASLRPHAFSVADGAYRAMIGRMMKGAAGTGPTAQVCFAKKTTTNEFAPSNCACGWLLRAVDSN